MRPPRIINRQTTKYNRKLTVLKDLKPEVLYKKLSMWFSDEEICNILETCVEKTVWTDGYIVIVRQDNSDTYVLVAPLSYL